MEKLRKFLHARHQALVFMRSIEAAAPSHGMQAVVVPVRTTADIEPAFEGFTRAPNGGLILPTDSFTNLRSSLIIDLAARHRLPEISAYESFPKDGGLMYYGTDIAESYRQMGAYAGQILKGAKPADLPVVQLTKFEFVINLRTAKALALPIPPGVLAITDEVIE